MATIVKNSRETTIYVSTSSKLNFEQTESITNELLRIIGFPNDKVALKFNFIDGGDLIEANASVDNELKLSINN